MFFLHLADRGIFSIVWVWGWCDEAKRTARYSIVSGGECECCFSVRVRFAHSRGVSFGTIQSGYARAGISGLASLPSNEARLLSRKQGSRELLPEEFRGGEGRFLDKTLDGSIGGLVPHRRFRQCGRGILGHLGAYMADRCGFARVCQMVVVSSSAENKKTLGLSTSSPDERLSGMPINAECRPYSWERRLKSGWIVVTLGILNISQ